MKKEPKQERAITRVNAIYAAAEALIIHEEASAISTTAIAEKANVPIGSVYQYFDDKDEILRNLYHSVYDSVLSDVEEKIQAIPSNEVCIQKNIQVFWEAAKKHPSFRPLTRWANATRTMWDVTPNKSTGLAKTIKWTLSLAGFVLPKERHDVILQTIVITLSILVDLAIEEKDEEKAQQIIDELKIVITSYLSSINKT